MSLDILNVKSGWTTLQGYSRFYFIKLVMEWK